MYELKKIGKVFTSKFVGPVPSSYKKRIYRAAVSQRLRNTALTRPPRLCAPSSPIHSWYRETFLRKWAAEA
jgi:hypothetical protein